MRHFLLSCAAALLAGCGYVGDPLPPALNIPQAVTDLRILQRGSRLLVDFTAPALTTESLAIRHFAGADLRIGPVPAPFALDSWSAAATKIDAEAQPGKPVHVELVTTPWQGREVLAAVRLAGPKGRFSAWSKSVRVAVTAPLAAPESVAAAPAAGGVRVVWKAVPGESYRVYKQASGAQEPTLAGSANTGEFFDRDTKPGATYQYHVQAVAGNAESETSAVASVVMRDLFPPAVPAGLTAVAGIGSVELTWERNTEVDLAGYRIYRAEGDGAAALLADAVLNPAYSDRQTSSGKQYRYIVTSVDQAGNESGRSAEIAIAAP